MAEPQGEEAPPEVLTPKAAEAAVVVVVTELAAEVAAGI